MTAITIEASEPSTLRRSGLFVVCAYAATIFLSAFLLFQVQPLISKFILPWFGGSPAVWTTCMLFFQLVLFGGYAYAHMLAAWLGPKMQLGLHVVLLLAAASLLPIVPDEVWKPLGNESPTLRILLLLGATVGLPYFALSSTGPLLQSWFSDAFPDISPYRLFALSNLGSLLALLSYPFFFEIYWNSTAQAWMWSGGFMVFVVCCAFCAYWTFRIRSAISIAHATSGAASSTGVTAERATSPLRVTLWVFLPAMASVMLLAVTNYVCQDVAVVPLLWIVPLSLYLLSFIISFDHPRWYNRSWCAPLTALMLFLAAGMYELPDLLPQAWQFDVGFVQELGLYFGALFLVCLLCHAELAGLRPATNQLTAYYLMISAGGALGGIFVSLIAPQIFTTFYEWPLGLVACFLLSMLLTAIVLHKRLQGKSLALVSNGALGSLALVGAYFMHDWQSANSDDLYNARNFYGTVSVRESSRDDPEQHHFNFVSGSIKHGKQYANPTKRRLATAYYGGDSGCAVALEYIVNRPNARIGVVGLGVGTIATYAKPGQYVRFYEINPEVETIARQYFTYLSDCEGTCEVALGDARLTLEREAPNQFDALVLDAFSGDSIPAHLLTDEAFHVYKKHLKPDGMLILHITNSYLCLFPVADGLAKHHGYQYTRIYREADPARLLNRSDYMILTNDEKFLAANPSVPPKVPDPEITVPLWTDQYSNLFMLIK